MERVSTIVTEWPVRKALDYIDLHLHTYSNAYAVEYAKGVESSTPEAAGQALFVSAPATRRSSGQRIPSHAPAAGSGTRTLAWYCPYKLYSDSSSPSDLAISLMCFSFARRLIS